MENNNIMQNQLMRNVAVGLGCVLIAFVAAKAIGEFRSLSHRDGPATDVITVSGKGEIIATPDIATFSFGVTEESSDVAGAQKKATEKINTILGYLKDQGVEDKDIKTSSYNIYPRYDYQGASYYVPGKQVLAAYVVSQNIVIKVRDLDKAGTLLSGIGEYGATDVSGLTFSIDEQDAVVREARDKAITDAREQAEILAKSLGVSLGKITSFYESSPYQPYPSYYAKDAAYGMGGEAMVQNSAPELPSGENKITSTVTITYEIR